jgi:hypothetical protein
VKEGQNECFGGDKSEQVRTPTHNVISLGMHRGEYEDVIRTVKEIENSIY